MSWNTASLKFAERPDFKAGAIEKTGTVALRVDVNPDGTVKQAQLIAGEARLSNAVMESARTWRFLPTGKAQSERVFVYFTQDGPGAGGPPPPPPPPFGAPIDRIDLSGVDPGLRDKVLKAIGVRAGDALTEQRMDGVRKALSKFDPPLRHVLTLGAEGRLVLRISER